MKQRDPDSFAQLQSLHDYFNLLKQRDPNLFSQFNSLHHFFIVMKQNNPNSFALELAKRLVTPSIYTAHYHEICAELLWILLTEDHDLCTWRDLPASTQSTIKTTLLDRILKEEPSYTTFALHGTVVRLAPSLTTDNDNNSWPELLPSLYQCVTSSTSHNYAKVEAFAIFAQLAEKIGETMFSSLSLHSVLCNTLYDDTLNMDVRVAAMFAATNFILRASSSNEKERFQYLLPGMMKTLTDSVSNTLGDLFFPKEVPLQILMKLDDVHPRVQAQAILALSAICESYETEALIPHLDEIVNKLLVLLQNEKKIVQQGALQSFTNTAICVKENFQTYYDTVMPHLKGVLRNADLNSDLSLCADAIQCISFIGLAVGKEKFREDAKQIIEVFIPLQGLQERVDDINTWDILRGCIRIWECLGKELLPYLSAVITLLIGCDKWHDENHGVDDKSIESAMFRDKNVYSFADHHSRMGKLAYACELVTRCAKILKEDFHAWIPQVISVLVPLLKFHSNNLVRRYAVEAMPSMLCCAKLAVEKGIAQGASESYFKELSDNIIKALVEALHKEQVGDLCVIMLYILAECVQVCGPLLHKGLVRSIVDEIKHVSTHSSFRKQELIARTKFEDFDDEEAELLKDERGLEEDIFIYVCEILQALIRAFKAAFLPFLDELSSYLLPMLKEEKTTSSERNRAICIFVNVVVLCPEAAGKYYEVYFPLILGLSDDEDPDVRKMALYGLRLWAKFGHSSFKNFVGDALLRINKVILHPKALEPVNEIAYNYAVSALGRICQFQGESIDLAQVIPVWLNCLPIKAHLLEAKIVHEQLCSMVERSQKELFGPNNQYIPKIVSIFAEVLCSKNDLAYNETANRMINVLRCLQRTIPTATLLSEVPYLLPQHEMELKSILSLDEDANYGCRKKIKVLLLTLLLLLLLKLGL